MIQPVQRDCICPPPKRNPGEHDKPCNDAYREKFFGAKLQVRNAFYARDGRN